MKRTAARRTASGSTISIAALALALAFSGGAAHAQQAPDTPADQDSGQDANSATPPERPDDTQIIVTGSRLARSTFNTTSPVTVIDQKDIQNLNLTDVGEVLKQLPSNSNFFAANNVGLGNFNVGAQLVNLRGLNPFFGTRTLTLVDTHRVVPTTTGGGVDITLIPSMLVGRTETVTGGASAIYGSDAIAGVVNIILDTRLEGLKAQADFTRTTYGDGNEYHGSLAYGTGFAGDRGHFVIGGEYQRTEAIGICSTERPWCATEQAFYTNPNYAPITDPNTGVTTPANGQPAFVIGPGGTSANTSLTGMLARCIAFIPGAGICAAIPGSLVQLNPAGTDVIPYQRGAYSAGAGFFGFQQGGDQYSVGAYDTTTLRPEVTRYTALAHLTYEFSPAITASLEGSYARSEAVNPVANGAIGPYALEVADYTYLGYRIAPDNAFLTPAVAAAIGPNGAEFGRNMVNVATARNETNNDTWRIVGSLEGNLGGSWGWDAYASHGQNKNDQHLFHNAVSTLINYALDAVNTGAGIVCGVTIPGRVNPNTGLPYSAADVAAAAAAGPCTPLNLFGVGNASQQAVDYAYRTLVEFSTYRQDVGAVNIRGNLFDGWGAGVVKLAVGAEYRREHGIVTHDLANQPWYTDYTLSYGLDYAGTIEVAEAYGELNIPVFSNWALGKYFEIDAAARGTHNKATGTLGINDGDSASHDFATWKASGVWDVTDWLRFRGTRSRDVRAPQFRELFQSYAVTAGGPFGSVNNPFNNGLSTPLLVQTGGDVNLRPEKADTLTLGIVLAPKSGFAGGFRFSADWYEIRIKDAIVGPPFGLGAQNIISGCYNDLATGIANSVFCPRVTFQGGQPTSANVVAIPTALDNTAVNIQSFTTRGVDFESAYSTPILGDGMLTVRALASYLYDLQFGAGLGGGTVNYAGQSGPTAAFGSFNTSPKWQGNLFVTLNEGPFTGSVQMRYIGPGRFETITANGGLAVAPGDPGYSPTDPNSISDNSVDSAVYFNLSTSYRFYQDRFELFGSVNNVFNKDPAIAPGGNGYPTNPVYFDTYGRTFRVGVRLKL